MQLLHFLAIAAVYPSKRLVTLGTHSGQEFVVIRLFLNSSLAEQPGKRFQAVAICPVRRVLRVSRGCFRVEQIGPNKLAGILRL
jgi:hypothetical protein